MYEQINAIYDLVRLVPDKEDRIQLMVGLWRDLSERLIAAGYKHIDLVRELVRE